MDSLAEYGGFALDADNVEMLACLDEKLDWLTDDRRLGYAEWRADPGVFRAGCSVERGRWLILAAQVVMGGRCGRGHGPRAPQSWA